MRISDWSSDVCSSDLFVPLVQGEADHLNQRAAAQILFLDPAVHLVDIGLVVLDMVEIQRRSRHLRGQRVPAERKRQKFKSHATTPYINHLWGPPVRSTAADTTKNAE